MSVLSLWGSVRMEVSVSTLWVATPADVRSSGRGPTVPLMWTSVRCRSVRMVLPVSTHLEDSPVSVHLDGKERCVNKVGNQRSWIHGTKLARQIILFVFFKCLHFFCRQEWVSECNALSEQCSVYQHPGILYLSVSNGLGRKILSHRYVHTQSTVKSVCTYAKYCHIGMSKHKVLPHNYVQMQSTVT